VSSSDELSVPYRLALAGFLSGAGESALSDAYEIGRRMLSGGIGLLGLAQLHHDALRGWLKSNGASDAATVLVDAGTFFAESLSSFEMHFRRIDESSAAWRRVNDLLEEEVKRIALALHNEAGNILAQATLEMDLVLNSIPEESRTQLALARRLLDETGEQLRHLSHELRPSVLDDLGLVPALEFLAEGVERRTGMRVRVQGEIDGRLTSDIELAVYRIAQEAINNALRHAGESPTVTMSAEMREDCLHFVIADDGAGFDVEDVLADKHRYTLGLVGMRERAVAFGGACRIESRPGGGTTVELKVPL
jgi:two-component system sensor histidine kinase DegS